MGGEGKSNNTKQKEEREEKKRKDRSSETVFEGDAAGENGGDWRVLFGHRRRRRRGRLGEWTKPWMARAVVAVVVGVAIIIICTSEKNHREEEEEDDGGVKEEDERRRRRRRQTDGYHRADFVDGIRHPLWFHEIVETTTTKNVEDERREGDVFILAFALFKGFEIVVFRTAKAKNGRVNRTGIESQFPRKPTPNARTSRFSEPSFLGR